MRISFSDVGKHVHTFNVPYASRLFFHPAARILVWGIVNTFSGVTPNMLTYASFILRILAGYFILQGSWWTAFFFTLSYIVDCGDGLLARVTKKTSAFGAALDPFLDRISESLLFMLLLFHLFIKNDITGVLIVLTIFFIMFNEVAMLELCVRYGENSHGKQEKSKKQKEIKKKHQEQYSTFEARMQQFAPIFALPFGGMLKKYVTLTYKLRVNPFPSFMETLVFLFVLGPLVMYAQGVLWIALACYLPQLAFTLLRVHSTFKNLD
jgi:hypothetical protein